MSSKNELINVALKYFMVEGYQKTSLSKIANQLGMSKAALYYYYPNKKALFIACIEAFFLKMNEASSTYQLKGNTTKEKLFNAIRSFGDPSLSIDNIEGFNHYYFVFDAIKHVPEVKELLMSSSMDLMKSLMLLIEEGINEGSIRKDIDVTALIMKIGVLIEGLLISNYMGYFDDYEDMTDRILELLWFGISRK